VGKVLPQPEAETTSVARCDYVIGKRSVTLASEDEFQPFSPTLGLFHRADSFLQLLFSARRHHLRKASLREMSKDIHPSLFDDENDDGSSSPGEGSTGRKTEHEKEDSSDGDVSESGFSDRNTGEDASGDRPVENSSEGSSDQSFTAEERPDQGGFPDRNTSDEDDSGTGNEGFPGNGFSESGKSSAEEEPSAGEGSSTENESSSGSPAGGRPPKPPEERRDARLSVCMTEDLLARIEQQAEDAGLSKSAYARRALAGKDLQTRVDQQTLDTLYNAGVSMRKVQEAIEAGRRPKAADVEKALQALETVIEKIDQRGE
jgi:hypothetical protein